MSKLSFFINDHRNKSTHIELNNLSSSRILFITGPYLSSATGIGMYFTEGGIYSKSAKGIDSELSSKLLNYDCTAASFNAVKQFDQQLKSFPPSLAHVKIAEIISLMNPGNSMLVQQSCDHYHSSAGSEPDIYLSNRIDRFICYECSNSPNSMSFNIQDIDETSICPSCEAPLMPSLYEVSPTIERKDRYKIEEFIDKGIDAVFTVGVTEINPHIMLRLMALRNSGIPVVNVSPIKYKYHKIRLESNCGINEFFQSLKIK